MNTIHYGISFTCCNKLTTAILRQLPELFSSVELPGDLLENRMLFPVLKQRGIHSLNISELIDNAVSSSVAGQSEKIRSDFKRQLSERIENIGYPVNSIIMKLGVEEAIINEPFRAKLIKLLKELAMTLHTRHTMLALPVRIPSTEKEFPQFCLNLKTEVMIPQVKFSIDIHPHELGREFDPEKLLRWLKFDIGVFRFFYEPEIGNRLVAKAVKPWIDYLRQTAFEGSIIFCPRCPDAEAVIREAESASELIASLD